MMTNLFVQFDFANSYLKIIIRRVVLIELKESMLSEILSSLKLIVDFTDQLIVQISALEEVQFFKILLKWAL